MEFVVRNMEFMEIVYDDIHKIHNDESYDFLPDVIEVEDLTDTPEVE
jgi:hypothetical protein